MKKEGIEYMGNVVMARHFFRARIKPPLGELEFKDLVEGVEVAELGAKNLRLRICSRKWRNKASRTASEWRELARIC